MLRTKINVNLGVSRDCKDYDVEMKKVMSSGGYGCGSDHGSILSWRYNGRSVRKLTGRMPGHDRDCSGL